MPNRTDGIRLFVVGPMSHGESDLDVIALLCINCFHPIFPLPNASGLERVRARRK
jgi:hypothetical protein